MKFCVDSIDDQYYIDSKLTIISHRLMSSTPPQLKSKVTMDVTEKSAKEDYKSSDDSSSKVDEEKTKNVSTTEKKEEKSDVKRVRTTISCIFRRSN